MAKRELGLKHGAHHSTLPVRQDPAGGLQQVLPVLRREGVILQELLEFVIRRGTL